MDRKPKSVRLWQEIVLTLVLKGILLTAIWAAWFSAPEDRNLDASKVAAQLLSPQSSKEHGHDTFSGTR